jgi:hypothetical protein
MERIRNVVFEDELSGKAGAGMEIDVSRRRFWHVAKP